MTIQQAQEYVIAAANLDAERGLKNGVVDIKGMIMEINLFESLDKHYFSGQLVIVDDHAIIDEIELQGTETIFVGLEGGGDLGETSAFFFDANIVSIVQQHKQGDRQEVYAINFIARHAYEDETIKLSKSYTGKLEDIVEKIMLNELGIAISKDDYFGEDNESHQEEVRVITPYISPLETTSWLLDRATSTTGSPFFLWQSVWDLSDMARLGDLKHMIENGIAESKKESRHKFVYSVEANSEQQDRTDRSGPKGNTSDQDFLIKGFQTTKLDDTLKMIREGAVGSMLHSLDTYTTQKIEKHFSASVLIDQFEDKVFDFVLDQERTIGRDEKLEDRNARHRSLVTSYGTYNTINSYHDVFDQVESLNKIRPKVLKSFLYRNMIQASFHGIGFWDNELSVGDVLEIEYIASTTDELDTNKIALQRSGYYLIYDLKHNFQMNKHEVTCSLCKVRDLDDKPTYEGQK
jgi:hypothetical protein